MEATRQSHALAMLQDVSSAPGQRPLQIAGWESPSPAAPAPCPTPSGGLNRAGSNGQSVKNTSFSFPSLKRRFLDTFLFCDKGR